MTIAAFLCGLFYGAFFFAVRRKEVDRRRLNRILAGVQKRMDFTPWEPLEGEERPSKRAKKIFDAYDARGLWTRLMTDAVLRQMGLPFDEEACECDECCGCSCDGTEYTPETTYYRDSTDPEWGRNVPGVTFPSILGEDGDLSKVIRTGFEDG